MRAAVIRAQGGSPEVGEFQDPEPQDRALILDVTIAAIGPTDLMKAAGHNRPYPGVHIVNGEGVGVLANGSRAYFGHSVVPFGACAERTLVSRDEVWDIPENVSDEQAAALGISGTGALIALERAEIKPHESVLILGATGVLGQAGLQIARAFGAKRLVAAGRNKDTLKKIAASGMADASVPLAGRQDEDVEALRAAGGGGFDVILDVVYGPPAETAIKTLRSGGRMMSVGRLAGPTINLPLQDLGYRALFGVGTGLRTADERRQAFARLMLLAASGGLRVDTVAFPLSRAAEAWSALANSANAKILLRP